MNELCPSTRPEPRKDTGTAIIVIPGGSYKEIVQGSEGNEVAQWLADIGITGLSLWYRNAGWGYDGEAMILVRRVFHVTLTTVRL